MLIKLASQIVESPVIVRRPLAGSAPGRTAFARATGLGSHGQKRVTPNGRWWAFHRTAVDQIGGCWVRTSSTCLTLTSKCTTIWPTQYHPVCILIIIWYDAYQMYTDYIPLTLRIPVPLRAVHYGVTEPELITYCKCPVHWVRLHLN